MNTNARQHSGLYRVVCGLVAGALLAGLAFRFTGDREPPAGLAITATDGRQQPGGPATGEPGRGGTTGESPGLITAQPGASGGPSTATRPDPDAPLSASDVGVTASTIRVGIALVDLKVVGTIAGFDSSSGPASVAGQRATWEKLIDEVNRSGGILGRTIEANYKSIDASSVAGQRPACLDWTEAKPVFAVFGMGAMSSFGAPGVLCIAVEHETPLIDDTPQLPAEMYQQARGLLFNTYASGTRAMADMAYALDHYGKLSGRKLGLLIDQGQGEAMARDGLLPALRSLGHSVAYTGVVSTDPSQGPAQTVSHVGQMRSAGVNTVIDLTTFVNMTAFVTSAESQGWRPSYVLNSLNGNDNAAFLGGMPSSFDGATVITYENSTNATEDPVTKRCREHHNELMGTSFQAGRLDATTLRYIVVPCNTLELFVAAADAAGRTLTRTSLSAAVQSTGFPIQMRGLGGSWGVGKTDYDDIVRAAVWAPPNGSSKNCTPNGQRCWNDSGTPWNPRAR